MKKVLEVLSTYREKLKRIQFPRNLKEKSAEEIEKNTIIKIPGEEENKDSKKISFFDSLATKIDQAAPTKNIKEMNTRIHKNIAIFEEKISEIFPSSSKKRFQISRFMFLMASTLFFISYYMIGVDFATDFFVSIFPYTLVFFLVSLATTLSYALILTISNKNIRFGVVVGVIIIFMVAFFNLFI